MAQTVFERGLVEEVKILEKEWPYTKFTRTIRETPLDKIPPENMKVYMTYLVDNGWLWRMNFEQLLPAFKILKGDHDILTKMIFSKFGSSDQVTCLLKEWEKDPELYDAVKIVGASCGINPCSFYDVEESFREKLKSAMYRQVITEEQIDMCIMFGSSRMTPEQRATKESWVVMNVISGCVKEKDILDLAWSPREIRCAIHTSLDRDPNYTKTLFARLSPEDRVFMDNDLIKEFCYLSECYTNDNHTRSLRVFLIIRANDCRGVFTPLGYTRITEFAYEEESRKMVLVFFMSLPEEERKDYGDRAMVHAIDGEAVVNDLTAEYSEMIGDQTLGKLGGNKLSEYPSSLIERLTVYFSKEQSIFLEKILKLFAKDEYEEITFLLSMKIPVGSRIEIDAPVLTIDDRNFITMTREDAVVIEERLPYVGPTLCKKCFDEITKFYRQVGGSFNDYICPQCKTADDDEAECSVCSITSDIFHIRCGHLVCKTCQADLQACPVCRGPIGDWKGHEISDLIVDILGSRQ